MSEGRLQNGLLWAVQILLALLFLFAGGVKLVMPVEQLTKNTPLPGPFLRFIGGAEVVGAIGLILPWLLRIRPLLTPLAATCLLVIMVGAVVISVAGGSTGGAVFAGVTGALTALVGVARVGSLILEHAI